MLGVEDIRRDAFPPSGVDPAPCRDADPDSFFVHPEVGVQMQLKVCAGCHLREACLWHALDNDITEGVWGGVSEPDRRRMRQGRLPMPQRRGS